MKKQEKDIEFAAVLVRLRLDLPLRNAKAVQKKDIAKEAGVNLGSYSQAENGIIPGEKVLTRIARYFKVSEETLLHPPDAESLIYKDMDGGGQESQDKEGLFGKTRHLEVNGAGFAVTTHEPQNPNSQALAIQTLMEILSSNDPVLVPAIQANLRAFHMAIQKDNQLSEQTTEIENLKVEGKELKGENKAFEKRIAAIEEKLLSENNPREEHCQHPAEDAGDRKVA